MADELFNEVNLPVLNPDQQTAKFTNAVVPQQTLQSSN
jgi:hypothetical protein